MSHLRENQFFWVLAHQFDSLEKPIRFGGRFYGIFGNSDKEKESMKKLLREACDRDSRLTKTKKIIDNIVEQCYREREEECYIYIMEDNPKVDKDKEAAPEIGVAFSIVMEQSGRGKVAKALKADDRPYLYQSRVIDYETSSEIVYPSSSKNRFDWIAPFVVQGDGNFLHGTDITTFESKREAIKRASSLLEDPELGAGISVVEPEYLRGSWIGLTQVSGYIVRVAVVTRWGWSKDSNKWTTYQIDGHSDIEDGEGPEEEDREGSEEEESEDSEGDDIKGSGGEDSD